MMLTMYWLMKHSTKFTDEIFMKHRESLGSSGKVFVRIRQIYAKGTTRYFIQDDRITFLGNTTASITRCSLIGKDFSINFAIIVIAGMSGPVEGTAASRLMYLCASALNAHHGKLWCYRCKRCHDDELSGNIIEKNISSTPISTIVRTAKKFLFRR